MDIFDERFTVKDLVIRDKMANERKSLKYIVLELEKEMPGNAGVDVSEEVFRLLFTKLYDEYLSRNDEGVINLYLGLETDKTVHERAKVSYHDGEDRNALKEVINGIPDEDFRVLEFRNTGRTDAELKKKIQALFERAKVQWPGVFPGTSAFELSDCHLSACVSVLQDIKLSDSNLTAVGEAFEYLIDKSAERETAQHSTPRHFIGWTIGEKLSFRSIEEDRLTFKRRKAWGDMLENGIKNRIRLAPDVDVNKLIDEMYDVGFEPEE